ncbi:MAG TPA: sulfatase-like hydrolase/transferase [Anaerolineales bacterium]|nr:sulfatase-like hydrolase/transferase [Anaerolineales bacterium]
MEDSRQPVSRRDFLKLAALAPVAWSLSPLLEGQRDTDVAGEGRRNVIVLVFDAWSAHDVSLYGYQRRTTPNVEYFARDATVYHNHYTAGTFTVPGTASLLTGLLPWSHRAFQLGAGGITKSHMQHQLFAALGATHNTVAFAHNAFADLLVSQAQKDVDVHVASNAFNIDSSLWSNLPVFRKDMQVAYSSFDDNIFQTSDGYDSSLFLGPLDRLWVLDKKFADTRKLGGNYPTGLPESTTGMFRLEDLASGAIQILGALPEPSFAYLHFYPPHGLYHPTAEFANAFDDGWSPAGKPIHPVAYEKKQSDFLSAARRLYDQYMASWDAEAGRIFDYLSASGLLDRSYVILTSDHGEMFERGDVGHWTRMIYDPIIHIPLIIKTPGQTERKDVYAPTSSVDILPTIARMSGNPVPDWAEGQTLPGFEGSEVGGHSIFTVDAKNNPSWAPLTRTTITLTKDQKRLTYYNYPNEWQAFELYDLDEDPEELQNLYGRDLVAGRKMHDELMQRLSEVNAQYQGGPG